MSYYALVPAYNEQKNIREIISRLKRNSAKIIVVDDGSKDRTAEIAKDLRVKVLRHKTNRGKAEAIRTGLNWILQNDSTANYIVIIDSDLQFDPEEAKNLLKPLQDGDADFVSGWRTYTQMPFRHRWANRLWRTAFNIFFGKRLYDTNCGFVAMNRKAANIMRKTVYGGYILENAMFIESLKHGLRIRQVPVSVHYKKISGVTRGIRVVLGVLIFIVREGLKYRLGFS